MDDPIPPGHGDDHRAAPIRDDVTLRDQLRDVERDLRSVGDPWIKRDLGRRRRELRDELAARAAARQT